MMQAEAPRALGLVEHIRTPFIPVPWMRSVLADAKNYDCTISATDFLCNTKGSPFLQSWLLTQAVRHQTGTMPKGGDTTGIVPRLIGLAKTPDDTLIYLLPIAQDIVHTLKELDAKSPGIREKVMRALTTKIDCDVETFLTMDLLYRQMMTSVRDIPLTPDAIQYRKSNVYKLDKLAASAGGIPHLLRLYPEYQYPDSGDSSNYLTGVAYQMDLPIIDPVPVIPIIPPVLQRDYKGVDSYNSAALIMLRRLGMAGNVVARSLAEHLKGKINTDVINERISVME